MKCQECKEEIQSMTTHKCNPFRDIDLETTHNIVKEH